MVDRERPDPLASAFRALIEDEADSGASPAVEARLLTEVRTIGTARRQHRNIALLAVAAAVLLAFVVPGWLTGVRVAPQPGVDARFEAPEAAGALGTAPEESANAFFPLAYSEVPVTDGRILRLSVPSDALAAFGLTSVESFESPRPGVVLADVVVGDDGLARAVRFVRNE